VRELNSQKKFVESERLQKRVTNDLAMFRETGFCSGGENYSRHLAGRKEGEPPDTLLDYFALQKDWLLVVDESHVTLPQLKAMYAGDQSRKRSLVKHGFRLPSALDNRPLKDDEFWEKVRQAVFVSATPSQHELNLAQQAPVEMLIRPTFVCDPHIEVRPKEGQLEDLLHEVRIRAKKGERTLAVALTKRDAEDLASYLIERDVKSAYIHSGLKTTERSDALRSLQHGEIDCLVGVNLLREGLDLPEVSLVAILNADSEGFLRSETALLQSVGRAARNAEGKGIFYANRITDGMKRCMDATARRRQIQLQYNKEHGCEMKSTEGSSTLSIFDLLKDKIEAEKPLQVVNGKHGAANDRTVIDKIYSNSEVVVPGMRKIRVNQDSRIETDHVPASPGVYFWKDDNDNILYIGKANSLRSRVRSYLSTSAKHGDRIKAMLNKARSVDFVLTPSGRDALVLESNLIKHHQPPFNVLLKDDEHYPYICARVGDPFPNFCVVPRREENASDKKSYRYFGPYTSFREINSILEGIEEKYELRSESFLARQGSGSKEEYRKLFDQALHEVFEGDLEQPLVQRRQEFEEAGQLFDSSYNQFRDVVAVAPAPDDNKSAVVQILQLRDGLVAGHFSYSCELPFGIKSDDDYSAVIQSVLESRHYPSGQESMSGGFSWFPDEILITHAPSDPEALQSAIQEARSEIEPRRRKAVKISTGAKRGPKKVADARALEFALTNVQQVAYEKGLEKVQGSALSSVDGTASSEIKEMLSLDRDPVRIEAYDISHTQGSSPVGSRTVFVNGKPVPSLYRQFNIKTVEGIDDYASLGEILERRFRRAWVNGVGGPVDAENPWALPDLVVIDGGPGQLSAAVEGMSKARVVPPGGFNSSSLTTRGSDRMAVVPICALAKREEKVFVPTKKEHVNENSDSPALLLLRSLRDESHRFALNAHRNRRSVAREIKQLNS